MESAPQNRSTRRAFILLTFAAVFWGGTWVTGKLAVDPLPPRAPARAPVLPALLAWPLRGEKMSRWCVAGLITGLAGLVLVINPNGGQVPAPLLGAPLFFGGALFWAVFSLIGKAGA